MRHMSFATFMACGRKSKLYKNVSYNAKKGYPIRFDWIAFLIVDLPLLPVLQSSNRSDDMKKQVCRGSIYALGMLLLAIGVTLSTRTNLGSSPITSVPYCLSYILDWKIGDATLLVYSTFVIVEVACHLKMKEKRTVIKDILQIPVCVIFTRFMNLFAGMVPEMTGRFWIQITAQLIAILLIGTGMVLALNVRLIPNPADGIIQTLADFTGKKMGTVKNIADAICVTITLVTGYLCTGRIVCVGIGTVMAMILVGRVVALGNKLLGEKINKFI